MLLIKQKGNIDSSYFFNQIFTRLGIFNSVHDVIDDLSKEGLIMSDGYFDEKLVKDGWDIEWVFKDKGPSKGLKEVLQDPPPIKYNVLK